MTSNVFLQRYVAPAATGIVLMLGLSELKASDTMGIPAPGSPRADGQSNYSDDIFRIELCGPGKSHLSVIDVPGVFRTTEQGVTTEDKLLVKNMVRRYVQNPRTIILAVLAANVDIATTEILDMAAEVDSSGQRTLGILNSEGRPRLKWWSASICAVEEDRRIGLWKAGMY